MLELLTNYQPYRHQHFDRIRLVLIRGIFENVPKFENREKHRKKSIVGLFPYEKISKNK